MKIYIGHSTSFDYKEKLYQPVKNSKLAEKHEIIFPHESEGLFDSKKFFEEECDLIVAEVSQASTGLGIELGWADEKGISILCVHRKGSDPSSALEAVTEDVVEYETEENLVELLETLIDN